MSNNPLALDLDKPNFVNAEGVKWWTLDMGDKKDGLPYRVMFPDGDGEYLIVKDGRPIYSTKSLEQLAWKFTELKIRRTGHA